MCERSVCERSGFVSLLRAVGGKGPQPWPWPLMRNAGGFGLWEGRLPGQKTIENEDKGSHCSYRPESNFGTSDTVLPRPQKLRPDRISRFWLALSVAGAN